jgi:glycosyltransferase involved in cell wall biosynthesis
MIVPELASYLSSEGHEVDVWTPSASVGSVFDVPEVRARVYSSHWYRLLSRLGLLALFPFFVPSLAEWDGYDVVYTTTMHAFRIYLRSQSRVLVGTHDYFLVDSGRSVDRASVVSRLREAVSLVVLRLARRDRVGVRSLNGVISSRVALTGKRIFEIPDFAPSCEFEPTIARTFEVLSVGQVSRRKGGDLLLDVAKLVRNRPELRLASMGLVRPEFAESVAKFRGTTNVQFLGPTSDGEKYRRLSTSGAALLLSRREASPLVAVEALSLGVPVVSTWSWAREVFPSPGLIMARPTADGVLTAVGELYSRWSRSAEDYLAYRRQIRAAALAEFGRDRVLPRLAEMFARAASGLA